MKEMLKQQLTREGLVYADSERSALTFKFLRSETLVDVLCRIGPDLKSWNGNYDVKFEERGDAIYVYFHKTR